MRRCIVVLVEIQEAGIGLTRICIAGAADLTFPAAAHRAAGRQTWIGVASRVSRRCLGRSGGQAEQSLERSRLALRALNRLIAIDNGFEGMIALAAGIFVNRHGGSSSAAALAINFARTPQDCMFGRREAGLALVGDLGQNRIELSLQ